MLVIRFVCGLLLFFFIAGPFATAQRDCRVKQEGLTSFYRGECRSGIAHGRGLAEGNDGTYEGKFVKGYPEGEGKMLYKDDSKYVGHWDKGKRHGKGIFTDPQGKVLEGYWKNDEYIGEYERPYEVYNNRGSARPYFRKSNDFGNYIEIHFQRSGAEARGVVRRVLLQNSSGNQINTTAFTGFQNVEFPFEGKIEFVTPNMLSNMGSPETQVEQQSQFEFTIYEPGDWVILVKI